jgi:5-methylcytosine-specific restriction enzyme A
LDQLPFIPNQIYNRRVDIHAKFGGGWQGGISPSADHPYIFIFTSQSGEQHGYLDGWDNPNVFSYTGEGQIGDMKFIRGNLALRDHKQNGKRVFLFESVRKGFVKFIGEVEVFDVDYFETPDSNGAMRTGIKFFFKRKGIHLAVEPERLILSLEPEQSNYLPPYKPPNETERKGLVTSRVGQGAYRKRIIHRWQYKCAVTGFEKLDVLIASHITPWAESTNEERLDVNNGILLSPAYDALFDRHLITFENSGKIILSDKIETQAFEKIRVNGHESIRDLREENFIYLEKHRHRFYESH